MAINRAQQARWGRVGGLRTAARHDVREITAPARLAFEQRFYVGIPDALPLTERERRAAAARRAYFAELTARSIVARKKKGTTAVEQRRSAPEVTTDAARLPRAAA